MCWRKQPEAAHSNSSLVKLKIDDRVLKIDNTSGQTKIKIKSIRVAGHAFILLSSSLGCSSIYGSSK